MRIPSGFVSRAPAPPPSPRPAHVARSPLTDVNTMPLLTAGHDSAIEEELAEMRDQLATLHDQIEPLRDLNSVLQVRLAVQQHELAANQRGLECALAQSRDLAAANFALKCRQGQMEDQIATALQSARLPRLSIQVSSVVSYLAPPAVWVPPGPPPQLCYPGRSASMLDLVIIHAWYRRLGAGVVQARYSAEEYRHNFAGRNRVEIRDQMPAGYLHGWVESHEDHVCRYYVPALPIPGWPTQLRIHNNPAKGIFICAVVYDGAGARASQDGNILQHFLPRDVTCVIDTLSLYWEKTVKLSRSRDLDKYARDVVGVSDEFRKCWDAASGTMYQSLLAYPRRSRALFDIQRDERSLTSIVVNILDEPGDQRWWKLLAMGTERMLPNLIMAEHVLAGIICHELGNGQPVATDTVEMFANPFMDEFTMCIDVPEDTVVVDAEPKDGFVTESESESDAEPGDDAE
ncbi:uncharacterized protein PV07_08882 [Cladophialophora immunda]|uniref:Uncharacterized protein n=1 Tax=Cladophialophora immunda TaxID=569365 RepID=A0A0D2AL36_9EURO|nr:uncharacterized protein PV07_08882 [Cladophialophora immunda]KIW25727.1 hypothetical protein PV07_08882 [Cladophialophora immunda]OQU96282.1 hypothetical protein CLAIMM_02389 [Cladophialophora immunda]